MAEGTATTLEEAVELVLDAFEASGVETERALRLSTVAITTGLDVR